jgi:acetyl-CoA carboxylase biotin carboxyl carrier protein
MAKQNNTADVEFIKALAELLHENGLTELEVKREYGDADRLNVRVSRMQQVVQTTVQAPAAPSAAAPAAPAVAAPTDSDPVNLAGAVKSPMVGTVYMASEPGSDPFVKVGDKVSEGDTLLIIEAMKTMNQIPAPHSGTIKRILASDGTAVEFGAPLMIIE